MTSLNIRTLSSLLMHLLSFIFVYEIVSWWVYTTYESVILIIIQTAINLKTSRFIIIWWRFKNNLETCSDSILTFQFHNKTLYCLDNSFTTSR